MCVSALVIALETVANGSSLCLTLIMLSSADDASLSAGRVGSMCELLRRLYTAERAHLWQDERIVVATPLTSSRQCRETNIMFAKYPAGTLCKWCICFEA